MASDTETKTKTRSSGVKTAEVRTRLAQVIEVAFTIIAAFLVLGAVLIALYKYVNQGNSLVEFVKSVAAVFDGPLSRNDGIFDFSGKTTTRTDMAQNALANWGIAAGVYLIVGRVLGKIIRP